MIAVTNGIVLRKLKYGDSSQIVQVFTEHFGLQSYILKGLGNNRRSNAKGNLIAPGALLEWTIYHKEDKNIKLIKDIHPAIIYQNIGEDIIKNTVAVFAMEVILNLLIQDDVQPELYELTQSFLIDLDKEAASSVANYPIFFLIQAGKLSGYYILGNFSHQTPFLNLIQGCFSDKDTNQRFPILTESLADMSALNTAKTLVDIRHRHLKQVIRKAILNQFLAFFELHMPHFRPLKSVAVLSEILS